MLGGLVLLPLIGLKAMLIAGAAIDMGIGAILLARAGRMEGRGTPLAPTGRVRHRRRWPLVVGVGVQLDRNVLASGVYRTGRSGQLRGA